MEQWIDRCLRSVMVPVDNLESCTHSCPVAQDSKKEGGRALVKAVSTQRSMVSIEKRHLGAQTRAKGQCKARSTSRPPSQPLKNEQDCCRRHVAMLLKNPSGFEQLVRVQRQSLATGRENPGATRMDCPTIHRLKINGLIVEPISQPGQQGSSNRFRNKGRQAHRKTMVANLPVHQI